MVARKGREQHVCTVSQCSIMEAGWPVDGRQLMKAALPADEVGAAHEVQEVSGNLDMIRGESPSEALYQGWGIAWE